MSPDTPQEVAQRYAFEQAYRKAFPVSCMRSEKFKRETWGEYADVCVLVGWEIWKAAKELT